MQAGRKQRVLVVDDESAMNELIADILGEAGFKVFAETDGAGALEAFRARKPDVVILDIFMPNKDGLEVLIEMRHQRLRVPVLVISGKQTLLTDSSMGLAKQLGASDVLAKPFTPEALVERVSCLVQAAEGQSQLEAEGSRETTFLTLRRCVDLVKARVGRWRGEIK